MFGELVNKVGNALSDIFGGKSNSSKYVPVSQINQAAKNAYQNYRINPYYDYNSSVTPNSLLLNPPQMNNYGKSMTQLDQIQNKLQPAIDTANKNAQLINWGVTHGITPYPQYAAANSVTSKYPAPLTSSSKVYGPPVAYAPAPQQQNDSSSAYALLAMLPSMMQQEFNWQHPTPPAFNTVSTRPSVNPAGASQDFSFLSQLLPDVYGNITTPGSATYGGA